MNVEESMTPERNGIKKAYAISMVFFFVLSSFLPLIFDNTVHAEQTFSSTSFISFKDPVFTNTLMDNTSYVSVSIEDCMLTGEPGAAQLPFYATHILIPDGCKIKDILVSEEEFVDYSEMILSKELVFAEEEIPFSSGNHSITGEKNQSWYELNSFHPSKAFQSVGVSYMKGYPVETIHVFPLRYNPNENLLWFHGKLEITVTFSYEEASLSSTPNQFFRKQNSDAEKVKNLVLNPELVDTYPLGNENTGDSSERVFFDDDDSPMSESYSSGLCDSSENYQYVIVTTESLASASNELYNWSDLIDHRMQRNGLSGCIVTMEEIQACSDYFSETMLFNDSAARLREFCKDAYLDWNTEYILLGGTWDITDVNKQIVPCRVFTDFYETGTDTMPSDLYFSNLDGDWYDDGFGLWGGGKYAANDKLSELAVGRIPVWNEEMVSNVVSKIIWYDTCNDEEFLRSAGFLGGDLGWTATSKQYMEEIREGDGSFSQFEGFEEWNDEFPDYEIDTSQRYYEADYPTESMCVNAWETAMNNNEMCLISHIDHGSYTNTLSLDDGSSLSNEHFFLGTSQACFSGRYISGESGASTFLAKWADRGAFAMVLNTGYGYGSSSSTAGKSQLQHKIFWDYFFANQTTSFMNWRLGSAMQYTKDVFSSYIDSSSHVYAYVWYSWNLFGDPAQQIRMNGNVETAPMMSSENPDDDSINVLVNSSELSIMIFDENMDILNWSIETSPEVGNSSGVNDSGGEKTCSISDLKYCTRYTWFVNVSDGFFWTNQSYMFTTEEDPLNTKPVLSNPIPGNESVLVDVWIDNVCLNLTDSDGDNLSYTIQGTYLSDVNEYDEHNGSKNASVLCPLPYDSEITWFVNVSDYRSYMVSEFFVFSTRQRYYPSVPQNVNVQALNRTAVFLNWTKNASADGTIIERHTVSNWNAGEGVEVYNGTDNLTIDNSAIHGTRYYYQIWGYNTTDMTLSNVSNIINVTTFENSLVTFTNPLPLNNSVDCSVNLTFSIEMVDDDGDMFNWSIGINESMCNSSIDDMNGTKSVQFTNLSYYTVYRVWVNATDGFNETSEWYQFRTELPNDTINPEIVSVALSSTNTLDGSSSYGWDEINCTVTDNFRIASVWLNITDDENVSMNQSLIQVDDSSVWSVHFNEPILDGCNITLFVSDLNGNLNQTALEKLSIIPSLNFDNNHGSLDYSQVPTDVRSIQCDIIDEKNRSLNYSLVTSPDIRSEQDILFENKSIILFVSSISYETLYEFCISIGENDTMFVSTFRFTTENAPVDTNNIGGFPSGGGGGFLPPPAVEPVEEEEKNLPPKTPLPPTGPAQIELGEEVNCSVFTWDEKEDFIQFEIDWGDGSEPEFSDYVSSNESVIFSHWYEASGEYDIMVRAQDEQGSNSSWSESYTLLVEEPDEPDFVEAGGIVASVNNETGETHFDFESTSYSTNSSEFVWDFGDGVVLEGSSPTHQYTQPGTYTVTVTITHEDGKMTMKTYTICIPGPQKEVDTALVTSTESVNSVPWVFVLVGIILSFLGAVAVLKFR